MPSLRLFLAAVALVAQAALAQTPVSGPSGASSRVAGRVVLVEGDALHLDGPGALRSLRVGDRVYEGDRLITGENGELHLAMTDGGYIAVRPSTELRIDVFQVAGNRSDRSEISLVHGSFRTVTGLIGAMGAALIRTVDATIGVLGTDHETLVVRSGSARGEPGTYDRVNSGATYIDTPRGRMNVRAGEAGFVPRGEGLPPERLTVIPSLYRPTRNEGVFAGLNERIHEQVSKQIEKQRADRGDRFERGSGIVDRPDRPPRPERPERPERPQRPDKPDKPDKPDRGRDR